MRDISMRVAQMARRLYVLAHGHSLEFLAEPQVLHDQQGSFKTVIA